MNKLMAVDAAITIMEYMNRRNLSIENFNEELAQMKADGIEDFSLEDLDQRLQKTREKVDNF